MAGKGRSGARRKQIEQWKKKHPEGRSVYALKRKIEKAKKKGRDVRIMEEKLKTYGK